MPLQKRIEESDRLEAGQRAEGIGLRAALMGQERFTLSSNPYLQARFEAGWDEGKTLLAIEAQLRKG